MKTSLVLKYEFRKTFLSRSFLATLFLVPIVGFAVLLIVNNIQSKNQASASLTELALDVAAPGTQGFVDQSGLIAAVPAELSDAFLQYPDFASVSAALEKGEIASFFIITPDFMTSGTVEVYRPDFNPIGGMESTGDLTLLINANLLRDDPQVLERIQEPYDLSVHYLNEPVGTGIDTNLVLSLPYIITILFYFFVLGSASLLLSSVTKEKENRTIEILMTSVTPLQMLTGKIVALGLTGLLQTIVWMGAGWLMLQYTNRGAAAAQVIQVPASILIWGAVFFILGYAIYASLMAGIGALVSNLKESSTATVLVMIPLMIPLMLVGALLEKPNSAISLGLSLFPLTSPVAMMTRLSAVDLPLWQPVLAALLQALTAILIVRAVAGMFRAQNLLAGGEFKPGMFFRALLGRI